MNIANWSSRYETGIEVIDAQHKSLFDAVNRLAKAFRAGTASQQVRESMDFLVHYTEEHFREEERYMRDWGFPGVMAHEAEHTRLMDQVQKLQAKLAAGHPVTIDVAIFLADWLKRHINDSDLAYVAFLKRQEGGDPPT